RETENLRVGVPIRGLQEQRSRFAVIRRAVIDQQQLEVAHRAGKERLKRALSRLGIAVRRHTDCDFRTELLARVLDCVLEYVGVLNYLRKCQKINSTTTANTSPHQGAVG